MPGTVLVAYATKYGSTGEVANAIGQTLKDNGVEAEVLPVQNIHSLKKYSGIVLGAPLYMFHWHKKARRFLTQHRTELQERPVAVFALGPIQDEEKEWIGARDQLGKELSKFPWLHPVESHIMGGKFDPSVLGFPFSFIPALKQMDPNDIRDWKDIDSWAKSLIPYFP